MHEFELGVWTLEGIQSSHVYFACIREWYHFDPKLSVSYYNTFASLYQPNMQIPKCASIWSFNNLEVSQQRVINEKAGCPRFRRSFTSTNFHFQISVLSNYQRTFIWAFNMAHTCKIMTSHKIDTGWSRTLNHPTWPIHAKFSKECVLTLQDQRASIWIGSTHSTTIKEEGQWWEVGCNSNPWVSTKTF